MRLAAFTVEKYGNFERQDLLLDPAPGRLNLVVAPNGAGKSVLRQAFADLLFGIGGQSPMGFRFGYPAMRLAAEAIAPDGSRLRFVRRKGQGNTLSDAAGQPLPPVALLPLLGAADRTLLERLFALDTERLRQGGEELLRSDGALGDALLSAAGGVRAARRLQRALEEARDALAPRRKSAGRPFYRGLDALAAAQRARREDTLKPDAWQRQEAALATARQAQAEAGRAHDRAAAELARLNRIRRVRPLLARHDAAATWLAEHPDAPVLPADLGERLAQAREALHRAEAAATRAATQVRELTAQRDALQPDAAVLAEAEAIAALVQEMGAARKAEADLPPRAADRDAARRRIGELLRGLGHNEQADAAALVPPRAVLREAREVLTRHQLLTEPLARLPAVIADLAHTCDTLAADLAALPDGTDIAGLAALVQEIRAAGDPGTLAQRSAETLAEQRAAAALALARVPGWTADLAALAASAPAPLATYERLDGAREAAGHRRADAERLLAERRAALAESRRRLADLGEAGVLPDPAAIRGARAHRDAGWALIFRLAFAADPPKPSEVVAWAGEAPLPVAYADAVTQADALADRRMSEADRLAAAAALARTIDAQTQAEAEAAAALLAAAAAAEASASAWQDATVRFGLPAPSLADIREALARRDAALAAAALAAASAEADTALVARHAAWAERLARLLALPPAADLPALLAEADLALARQRRLAEQRALLADRLAGQRDQLAKAKRDLTARQRALVEWHAAWDRLRPRLARPDDEPPSVTADLLDQFAELDKDVRAEAALAERVSGMRDELARFGERTAALAARLAADVPPGDPHAAVRALQARLGEARTTAALRAQAEQHLEQARQEAVAANATLVVAQDDLRAIVATTGATDVDAAAAQIALAGARAEHAAVCAETAAALTEAGDGLAHAALREEAATLAPEALGAAIEAADADRAAASAAAQDAATTAGRFDAELRQLAAGDSAVAAAASEAAAVAELSHVLDEALLLHTAADLLAAALARVETESGGDLVARIAATFTTLTCGAYTDVTVRDDDAGVPRLLLIERGAPEEPKREKQLSEGTRDQLFLALRLVAIEDYAASAPAMPFLADDVLQTFDDSRALAAMRALVAFSATAQVIVLTHHRHLLEVAAGLPAGSVNVVPIAG